MDWKEESIWKNIQQKDLQAFEHYYNEHFKRFFLMACRYIKDSAQATEIVNDVFLKLWNDGEFINIDSSLKSYIYRAIINRSLNVLQKKKHDNILLEDIDVIPDDTYELRQIEENELKIQLYAAIDQLPTQCKKVFEMSRFEELKQKEIADKLGISIKTVKNHITIALKQISKAVSHYAYFVIFILLTFCNFIRTN